MGPVGVYTCVIPDAENILRSLTITDIEVFAEVTSNNGFSAFIPKLVQNIKWYRPSLIWLRSVNLSYDNTLIS